MNTQLKKLVTAVMFFGLAAADASAQGSTPQRSHNYYDPQAFPAKVSERVFEIPLDPAVVLAVVPTSLKPEIPRFGVRFKEKSGVSIPWTTADAVRVEDLRGKHLIIAGNIMDNPWILEMYMKRMTYTDAYFPGGGGYHIHPAKSVWDQSKNVLVIGASTAADLGLAIEVFVGALRPGDRSIGPVRMLKTAHRLPAPPASIEPALGPTIKDLRERPPYITVAQWGFMYFFTGERKWAELFRDGMTVLHRRAEASGKWITEPWSNIYFVLWNLFHAWELIDDDPAFDLADRRTIEDVLYGYTMYIQERPYLNEDLMPPAEPRQNHYTFLALSLDSAYTYYTRKYGIKGLERMADKVRRCFDDGQALSYRPNDDGGSGYQTLAPSHYLYYALKKGDLSFIESGRLRTQVDLIAATTDNRGDPVTFGDIGNYAHRRAGEPQKDEVLFPSVAAWFYKDGACEWLSNWLSRDSIIDLSPWAPVGMGLYAGGLAEAPPSRFLGILPVVLDAASLRWSSRRSGGPAELPFDGVRYFDKISFRGSFDSHDEYLLLDGTSTFAHGHQDGNTVTRLTWKDRVWLADLDYIKDGPQEHNGVSVVRNGVQDAPPPLNRLDVAADFGALGATETTTTGFNGADWVRRILWKKGRYFLFLDSIVAREPGDFRLENRWRLRGDVELDGRTVTARQGDWSFFIRSADDAPRELKVVPDDIYSRWDYPYGPAATTVCLAAKDVSLARGAGWVFANLLGTGSGGQAPGIELLRAGENVFVVDDSGRREIIGLDAGVLGKAGISTDCSFFVLASGRLLLFGLERLAWGKAGMSAGVRAGLDLELAAGRGTLLVPEESDFVLRGIEVDGAAKSAVGGPARLKPGKYSVRLFEKPATAPAFEEALAEAASAILPCDLRSKPVDFGIEVVRRTKSTAEISAAAADGAGLLFGTQDGSVHALDGRSERRLFTLPEGKSVLAIAAADIDGDGRQEIISSDSAARLFCHDAEGALRWTVSATPFFGREANVTEIAVDDIDGRGTKTILAATTGWKLYAVNPDGTVRWESFIYYHPLTRVRVLKNKSRTVIAVGTIYQTPLNVVDPATGVVIWKTWEQTGSETMSTTEYCGKVLRDLVFADTDGDGDKEIIFGNESHTIYALNAADGRMKWKAQVGDKVSAMALLGEGKGERGGECILTATEAGEVYVFDLGGRRLSVMTAGSGITGMEVLSGSPPARENILLSTVDGRVAVYGGDFVPKGSMNAGVGAVKAVFLAGGDGPERRFYAVGGHQILEASYKPYLLRPSRHY